MSPIDYYEGGKDTNGFTLSNKIEFINERIVFESQGTLWSGSSKIPFINSEVGMSGTTYTFTGVVNVLNNSESFANMKSNNNHKWFK